MRILFCGDVVGKSGRLALKKHIPYLRKKYNLSCVIVNGENATHGFGITEQHVDDLFSYGVDVITAGNHTWDRPDIMRAMDRGLCVIRPYNLSGDYSGEGTVCFTTQDGKRILVINVMANLFMMPCDNVFQAMQKIVSWATVRESGYDAIVVDLHGEACSEKYAMGHFCDGRVSLVVGTHTHTPTADTHIMTKGTGYQTDAGMCGDYNSVIGMRVDRALGRFLGDVPRPRLEPADGEGTLSGVMVEISPSGLCRRIGRVCLGGVLPCCEPQWG